MVSALGAATPRAWPAAAQRDFFAMLGRRVLYRPLVRGSLEPSAPQPRPRGRWCRPWAATPRAWPAAAQRDFLAMLGRPFVSKPTFSSFAAAFFVPSISGNPFNSRHLRPLCDSRRISLVPKGYRSTIALFAAVLDFLAKFQWTRRGDVSGWCRSSNGVGSTAGRCPGAGQTGG